MQGEQTLQKKRLQMACHSRGEYGSSFSDVSQSTKSQCSDSFADWRSREQLEPSQPSTSPAYWDSDDDDDCNSSSIVGPKPADLYGKFTWKIENFSEISKRELRSNVFEVGGYKWYILVYPQGCDVCNHLSLFLCVADYDKLLPGWSHFAQFTIAVVNKDPKKSKYSDTLHRFCKKEHDWGWKKFMELSKVLDGFTVADTLVIKAQVQVIRENPHRPFRCLDFQYRRELVRVYLTNVEGICRRFVEEKKEKLGKLIEDTPRWASFRNFWSAVENSARYNLAREKMDVILKAVVKRFFNEKEVTSTLVMDALYSGCKALDYWSKSRKGKINGVEMEDTVNPVIWVDKDAFVLAGDILLLLERAVTETLPPYKDDKVPQNRTKDVGSGDDFGKDSVERDERRLTELGRRTVEMFVLAHLYTNRVEVAYREAVALKRQEELIREEEAAGQAETEMRTKREAAEKEKRSKKKQAKQRRKDRKEKEKEAEEKKVQADQEQRQCQDFLSNECLPKKLLLKTCELSPLVSTTEADEDDLSGLDPIDDVIVGILGPAIEDGDIDRSGWGMEGSCGQNSLEASISGALLQEATSNCSSRKLQTTLDDSSSTCSSDSLPSVCTTVNESFLARPILPVQSHLLPTSEGNQVDSEIDDTDRHCIEAEGMLRVTGLDVNSTGEPSSSCSSVGVDSEAVILSLKDRVRWLEQQLFEKEEEVVVLQEQLSLLQHRMGIGQPAGVFTQEPLGLPHTAQCCGVVPAEEGSTLLFPTNGSEGFDLEKVMPSMVTIPGSGRMNRHYVVANGNGSLSRIPFLSGVVGNESRNSNNISGLAKLEPVRISHVPSRSRSVDSSRPPRILTPMPGFSMAGSGSFSIGEDMSLGNPIISTSSGMGLSISRPSSAPGLVTGSQSNIPLSSLSAHPDQPLARSMSVGAGRPISGAELGVGAHMNDLSMQSPITPSYKNATIGKARPSSWTGTAVNSASSNRNLSGCLSGPMSSLAQCTASSCLQNVSQAMVPPAVFVPLSPSSTKMQVIPGQVSLVTNSRNEEGLSPVPAVGSLALSCGMESAVVSQTILESNGSGSTSPQPSIGITFGTVTPELLKDDQVELPLPPDQLQNEHHDHSADPQLRPALSIPQNTTTMWQVLHQHRLQGPTAEMDGEPGMSGVLQTGSRVTALESTNNVAVTSEEFPYLDIINDLLDEDQNQGMARENLQHHKNLSHNRALFMARNNPNYGQLSSERVVSSSGGDVDRCRAVENGDEQACSNTLQMISPFQHPPVARLHCKNNLNRVSTHYWPIGSSAMPSANSSSSRRNGLVDSHIPYSLVQGHHLAVPDCSGFALGHVGYTVYTPSQQP